MRRGKVSRRKLQIVAALGLGLAALVFVLFFHDGGEKKIEHQIDAAYGVEDPQFLRAMGQLLGPSIAGGGRVTALLNGDQIFPAMLSAIQGAKKTITFETYIYWSGDIGQKFSDAFSERAQAGVRVHILLDAVGCGKIDKSYLEKMRAAGVEVERYHPIHWYSLRRLNNRTHRKLLVVDGMIGFTGGVGIADKWSGNADSPDHWRDSHFRLEGPAVAQMQAAFMDNWLKIHAKVLHGADYFPPLEPVGKALTQVFKSSPTDGSETVRLMYLMSIACARKRVCLSASYFVPDELSVQTLLAARARGVQVQIIVPGPIIDAAIVRKASRAQWGELLRAGVEIYEYQPTMFHCKVMVVDDLWVSVGSTNFDNRSFRLNDEANLNIYDGQFAREQVKQFETDKEQSRRVTLEEWQNRPRWEKFSDRAAAIFKSQL